MNTLASRLSRLLVALALPGLMTACAPITSRFDDLNWQPAVLDSDADGVPDYADKCPDTKPGVSVDAGGCPTIPTRCAEEFLHPGSPLFNCNPKLAQAQPKATNQTAGDIGGEVVDVVPIRATPIFEAPPANSPYSPRRMSENEIRPIIAGKPAIAASVTFEFGRADLTPKQAAALAKLAAYMKKNPQTMAVIYAYSQDAGLFGNGGLTAKRIDGVAERLINFSNIDKGRLSFGVLPPDSAGRKNAGLDNKIHVMVPSSPAQSPLAKLPPPLAVRPPAIPPSQQPQTNAPQNAPGPSNATVGMAGQPEPANPPDNGQGPENANQETLPLPVTVE